MVTLFAPLGKDFCMNDCNNYLSRKAVMKKKDLNEGIFRMTIMDI